MEETPITNKVKRVYRDLMKVDIICYSGEEYIVEHQSKIRSHYVIACADYIEIQIKAVIEEERRMPDRLRKLSRKEMEAFVTAQAALRILKNSHYQHLYSNEDPASNVTTRRRLSDWAIKVDDKMKALKQRIYLLFKIK